MLDLSKDRPATLNDIEQLLDELLIAMSSESVWLKSEEYRKLIGLGKTQFYYLKKIGALNPGIHPATRNSRRILVHKLYNLKARKIIWFPNQEIAPPEKKGAKSIAAKSRKVLQQQNLSKHSQQPLEKAGEYNMEKIHKNRATGSSATAEAPKPKTIQQLEKTGGEK